LIPIIDLSELHDEVHEGPRRLGVGRRSLQQVGNGDVRSHLPIQGTLSVAQIYVYVLLNLLAKLVLHMSFDSSKHEGLENHVQTPELVLAHVALSFLLRSVLNVLGEPFVELVVRIEETWHDEMEQSPKFCHACISGCGRK
jgi:hypothetical protein